MVGHVSLAYVGFVYVFSGVCRLISLIMTLAYMGKYGSVQENCSWENNLLYWMIVAHTLLFSVQEYCKRRYLGLGSPKTTELQTFYYGIGIFFSSLAVLVVFSRVIANLSNSSTVQINGKKMDDCITANKEMQPLLNITYVHIFLSGLTVVFAFLKPIFSLLGQLCCS